MSSDIAQPADDLQFTDTHCHIQEAWKHVNGNDATAKLWAKAGNPSADDVISRAMAVGVTRMVCVGTTLADSKLAVEFVQRRDMCTASIGLHPHEAKEYVGHANKLAEFAALASQPKVVAIGECGLDYFYGHSPNEMQLELLHFQLGLASRHQLPVIFHVRDAFDDFWPVFDQYPGIKGVIHSFTADSTVLEQALARNLYMGLNGIMTFTKQVKQLDAAKAIPLKNLLLETDAPFLTPQPFRGSICEPRHVRVTAEFLAGLRGETLQEIAEASTSNAQSLFGLT